MLLQAQLDDASRRSIRELNADITRLLGPLERELKDAIHEFEVGKEQLQQICAANFQMRPVTHVFFLPTVCVFFCVFF
jgi:chemotaxis regulatin CheY-phosphate phosphatase CheZ